MATTIRIAVTMNIRAGEAFEIALGLAQENLPDRSEIVVSYGVGNSRLGGFEAPKLLAAGAADLAFLNPSPVSYMALNGLAPYSEKIDIRNRADFPDDLAYAVLKAIAARKDTMPLDGDRFDMSRICRNTEEGPMCIPLHPGAERYYREAGYL